MFNVGDKVRTTAEGARNILCVGIRGAEGVVVEWTPGEWFCDGIVDFGGKIGRVGVTRHEVEPALELTERVHFTGTEVDLANEGVWITENAAAILAGTVGAIQQLVKNAYGAPRALVRFDGIGPNPYWVSTRHLDRAADWSDDDQEVDRRHQDHVEASALDY